MNFPSVPTDNLYKFIALTPIFLLILLMFFVQSNLYEFSNDVIILNGEINKLNIKAAERESKRKSLIKDVKYLKELSNCDCDIILTDTLIKVPIVRDGPDNIKEYSEQIQEKVAQYKKEFYFIEIEKTEIDTKTELINSKLELINIFSKISFGAYPILLMISFIGFRYWYIKTQKKQDDLLDIQIKKIKSEKIV